MIDFDLRVKGANEALKALSVLEPAVGRKVKQAINSIGSDLAAAVMNAAPGRPPVSGWRETPTWPAWAGITTTFKRSSASVVVQTHSSPGDVIASMVEFVGNGTKIRTTKGQKLSDMFNSTRYHGFGPTVRVANRKTPGRLGVKVLNEKYPSVYKQIEDACDAAVAEVNRRMP